MDGYNNLIVVYIHFVGGPHLYRDPVIGVSTTRSQRVPAFANCKTPLSEVDFIRRGQRANDNDHIICMSWSDDET